MKKIEDYLDEFDKIPKIEPDLDLSIGSESLQKLKTFLKDLQSECKDFLRTALTEQKKEFRKEQKEACYDCKFR